MNLKLEIKKKKINSKDITLNIEGKQFLEFCSDNNLCLLNGRTEGDLEGKITYVGPKGSSVIDFCCVPYDFMTYVRTFKVISEIRSDHMPIVLRMNIGLKNDGDNKFTPLLPKLLFTNEDKKGV